MAQDKETGRLRWASQRHPKGRPRKSTALSVFRRLSRASDTTRPNSTVGETDIENIGQNFGGTLPINGQDDPDSRLSTAPPSEPSAKQDEKQKEEKSEQRRIYINMRLPPEETHDDGTPLRHYPRNKIRTAKYTPLTFIPKNLYLQLHNIANIYFLFIVILQVCSLAAADLDIPHLWSYKSWSWLCSNHCNSHHNRHQRCHRRLATHEPRR
jgi:phospholipid-translocating ATPase